MTRQATTIDMQERRYRPVTHWIAILAILLNALVPSLSMALGQASRNGADGASPSGWTEVCSAQGSTWVRLAPDGSVLEQTRVRPADQPSTLHGQDCLYCLTHAGSYGLPPGIHALELGHPQHAVLRVPHALPARAAAPKTAHTARAPPAVS